MKGILLAGGKGTRLYPVTRCVNKHLLPVYDKPIIYYSLSLLMLANIQDILIITNPEDISDFKALLGDGSDLGLRLQYAEQAEAKGIAEAFLIGEGFIGDDDVCLMLGDNIFYGEKFPKLIRHAIAANKGATVFGYYVHDPERYGVVSFDDQGQALALEEKPENPTSNYAVTGLYIYDNSVLSIAKSIQPSARGELEITDVNKAYLAQRQLTVELIGRGVAWLDTGTHNSLLEAGRFIEVVESRQGLKIACLEEIAFRQGFIDRTKLEDLANKAEHVNQRDYLLRLS